MLHKHIIIHTVPSAHQASPRRVSAGRRDRVSCRRFPDSTAPAGQSPDSHLGQNDNLLLP